MILFVATNPSIDRTIALPTLVPHQVHRSSSLHMSAGGKAINVARACHILGCSGTITGFLGGHSGQLLAELVEQEKLAARWSYISSGETKMSHLLQHEDGDATVINEPGPILSREDWQAFTSLVLELAVQHRAVVQAGIIPPGVTALDYVNLCQELTHLCQYVFIDTPGQTLEAITQAPRGFSIKVNLRELSDALGQDLSKPGQLHAAIRSLIGAGAQMVGVTLGAGGAILATSDGAWYSSPTPVNLVSSVGSGDSFTAGLVCALVRGASVRESLVLAAAAGAANSETLYPAVFPARRVEELRATIKIESA